MWDKPCCPSITLLQKRKKVLKPTQWCTTVIPELRDTEAEGLQVPDQVGSLATPCLRKQKALRMSLSANGSGFSPQYYSENQKKKKERKFSDPIQPPPGQEVLVSGRGFTHHLLKMPPPLLTGPSLTLNWLLSRWSSIPLPVSWYLCCPGSQSHAATKQWQLKITLVINTGHGPCEM